MKRTRSPYAIGIALLVTVGLSGGLQHDAQARSPGYTFTKIATLGDLTPPPGGGPFVNDFEPGGLNSQGDMAFGADVSVSGGGEGVFLKPHNAQTIELGRTGGSAPGDGTFEFGFLGTVGLNDQGDMVFDFLLKDFTPPFGVNAGAYRYSHTTGKVTPVVRPFFTPVPGGGTFQGVSFVPTINNRGDMAFGGIVATDDGVYIVPQSIPPEAYIGLGIGIFQADAKGQITKVVVPGDAAPGGGTFDYAVEPWINDGGDVSFIGHIAGEESVVEGFPPQAVTISALGGLYVKDGAKGIIRTIVHADDPAPGGGNFRQAFHDVMNNRGDIVFFGDVTPAPHSNENIGVFLSSGGKIITVARPGDAMPGGGELVNASIVGGNVHINNRGDVVFSGVVDTDVDGDGENDTGLFQWSHGELNVIAKTKTEIPGVGTVFALASVQIVVPPAPIPTTTSGAINNDRGQVLFCATMTDGSVRLLLATPRP
jgi:hypothetical protein